MDQWMNRREFLRHAAIGAAALLIPPPVLLASGNGKRSDNPQRVLIVGAGMAGLAAALELVEAGHEVTVLEARTRPGGRVFTLRNRFAEGMIAEAGAARIPTSHDLTLEYVRRFGLETAPFEPEQSKLFRINGEVFPEPQTADPSLPVSFSDDEHGRPIGELMDQYLGPIFGEIGDPAAPGWPPKSLAKYDRLSIADLMRRSGASEGLVKVLDCGFGRLEAYSALEGLAQVMGGALDPQVRVVGGLDRLPRAMAEQLGPRIVYGTPVSRIRQDQAGVRVRAGFDGNERQYSADRLIVTVPFSVLRDVAIEPAFSSEKMAAIREMRYEPVTRVFLQTGHRFWRDNGQTGFAFTDDPMEIWDASHGQSGERGIMMAYMRDGLAEEVAAMNHTGRIEWGLERIGCTFPGIREAYQGGFSMDWGSDRWARGAYAYAAPGELMRFHHAAGAPEGRVHFAGEHTSVWPGWIQGALHSGLRAAQEISDRPVQHAGKLSAAG